MKIQAVLLTISVAAFIFSRIAKSKARNILVTADIYIDEERIKALGLFKGQEVFLIMDDKQGVINIYTKENGVLTEHLGVYEDAISYAQLGRKPIRAYIYGIYGNLVTVEIKLNDSL